MMKLNINKPTLILDKKKCLRNIQKMAKKAIENNLIFRPHFKTHQSAQIGSWYKNFGVTKITVSSVSMAKYFSENGWKDITIAFPFNWPEIDELNELNEKNRINILVADISTINYLHNKIKDKIGIYIKIDTGYHRSGIDSVDISYISRLLNKISKEPFMELKGFLTHAGHTYKAKNRKEIFNIYSDARKKILVLKNKFKYSYPNIIFSVGDTPSCSLVADFSGIDEVRPGNFVFYDLMQHNLGVCGFDDIAVSLACPVVSKNPVRQEIVIYGGAVHLSKEYIINNNRKFFGSIVKYKADSWSEPLPNLYLSKLSQEHGIIKSDKKGYNQIKIGDIIGVLPIHSCLTANLAREYYTFDGEIISSMNSNI